MVPHMQDLITEIETFCRQNKMSKWDFGELALNDRPFVGQLEAGRDIRMSTVQRVREWMKSYKPKPPTDGKEAA